MNDIARNVASKETDPGLVLFLDVCCIYPTYGISENTANIGLQQK